jgi:hypothetical protein
VNKGIVMKDRKIAIVTLVVCLALTGLLFYMQGDTPTPQQMCTKRCAVGNKSGTLVYKGPATPKSKSYDMDRDCECGL